ncbi:MAG: exodeoxyribonuclease small subunit [Planctomycetota bacterium]|jgi:exodeoxyribonuclease VII small subunit
MARDKPQSPATSDGLSFEQAMGELESLVERMEQGEVPLEESLKSFERGRALVERCRGILDAAERRIEQMGLDQLQQGGEG